VLRDYADELQPDLNCDLLRSFAPILKSTAVKLTRILVNHNMLESDFLYRILSVLNRVKI
jgi:succinate dehydrogenase flavin-adding protein (antitoxin of CptAB toxin-antitoxin module)